MKTKYMYEFKPVFFAFCKNNKSPQINFSIYTRNYCKNSYGLEISFSIIMGFYFSINIKPFGELIIDK